MVENRPCSRTLLAVASLACLAVSGCAPARPGQELVDGTCGTSQGESFDAAPASGLCSAGTASTVSGSGPWTWTCEGSNGGANASCSALRAGPDATLLPLAGNPDGSCSHIALPPEGQPADTSHPTTVVGTGTPESCTFDALASAVRGGGIITFNCGPGLVTIPISASLQPRTSNAYAGEAPVNTVIDGGRKVTLDGQNAVRIIDWTHEGSWLNNDDTLTLQHLRLMNGKATPTDAIAACPASGGISNTACSTGYYDGQGGALSVRDGQLRVIDVTFQDNQAALLGPDTGGGALYIFGTATPAYIVRSTFLNNKASNAGAIGMLWAGAYVFDSLFDGNQAVGHGANSDDASQCTCTNDNGQNQIGSGGNGGAVYKDGSDDADVTLCGDEIRNNSANEFGAAAFLTADGSSAKLVIVDTVLKNNAGGHPYWQWCPGVSTDNPYDANASTSSPQPVSSSFCDAQGTCTATCSG